MAAGRPARSFAARRITRSATKFRSRCLARSSSNDLKIKPSKLRGVESQGMLCSPSELGLSEESDGLLILSPEAKIGAPIGSLFPEDTILDVEITPNRGDLLSHFGLAREISALARDNRSDVVEADRGRRAPALHQDRRRHASPRRRIVHSIPRAGSRTSRSARARTGCAQNWNRSACAPSTTSSTSRIS